MANFPLPFGKGMVIAPTKWTEIKRMDVTYKGKGWNKKTPAMRMSMELGNRFDRGKLVQSRTIVSPRKNGNGHFKIVYHS